MVSPRVGSERLAVPSPHWLHLVVAAPAEHRRSASGSVHPSPSVQLPVLPPAPLRPHQESLPSCWGNGTGPSALAERREQSRAVESVASLSTRYGVWPLPVK